MREYLRTAEDAEYAERKGSRPGWSGVVSRVLGFDVGDVRNMTVLSFGGEIRDRVIAGADLLALERVWIADERNSSRFLTTDYADYTDFRRGSGKFSPEGARDTESGVSRGVG